MTRPVCEKHLLLLTLFFALAMASLWVARSPRTAAPVDRTSSSSWRPRVNFRPDRSIVSVSSSNLQLRN